MPKAGINGSRATSKQQQQQQLRNLDLVVSKLGVPTNILTIMIGSFSPLSLASWPSLGPFSFTCLSASASYFVTPIVLYYSEQSVNQARSFVIAFWISSPLALKRRSERYFFSNARCSPYPSFDDEVEIDCCHMRVKPNWQTSFQE